MEIRTMGAQISGKVATDRAEDAWMRLSGLLVSVTTGINILITPRTSMLLTRTMMPQNRYIFFGEKGQKVTI